MGCNGSSGSSGSSSSSGSSRKIEMKETKLADMDEFFNQVQGLVDEIYEIKDPVEEARDALLESTEFDTVTCGNTHHATVGIIFAISSQSNGQDINNSYTVTPEAPFIEINKGSASGDLIQCVENLQAYIAALTSAKDRIIPLSTKVKEFAEKAPELPSKAKDSIKSAEDLGIMDKIIAVRNTATNSRNLALLPTFLSNFSVTIKNSLQEIIEATKELKESKGKLSDIGKECAEKELTSPKDCYLECGRPINVSKETKKEWVKDNKRKRAAGKIKRGTEIEDESEQ